MIPSKTFLVGEYLALLGGPSLVVATKPFFKFEDTPEGESLEAVDIDLHPDSPAYRFALRHGMDINFKIVHPHPRQGGFGASTADFLQLFRQRFKKFTEVELFDEYQSCLTSPGSGADLIGQHLGGISCWEGEKKTARHYSWRFPNLEFSLFQSRQKVSTHEHLKNILLNAEHFNLFSPVVIQAIESFENNDENQFVQAINDYAEKLKSVSWVHPNTQTILNELRAERDILAAKGCGALGADVILLIHDKRVDGRKLLPLDYIAGSKDIAEVVN